ncbi:DUF6387 family protein [Pseudomonas sp. DSP3-2-2]|uniref:DUF6387 family protein n=1 Tax=unclassified Pseudomonas TaxID=196821 RepID=UPI003CEBA792
MGTESSFPPSWFNIQSYRGTEDFGALQWYEQLCRRQSLLHGYVFGEKIGQALEDRLWRIHVADEARAMRMRPLESVPVTGLAMPDAQPIGDLRVMDLMSQADRDRDARRFGLCDKTATQRWRVIRNPQASFFRHERLSQQPVVMDYYDIRKPPRAVIQVDLGATDAALRAAFQLWLDAARNRDALTSKATPEAVAGELKRKGKARLPGDEDKTRKATYDRYTKYKLLPYLDLALWAMETDTNVTWPMYAEALCDGHYRTHDDIRKTTHNKYAAPLMRDLSKLKAFVGYGE